MNMHTVDVQNSSSVVMCLSVLSMPARFLCKDLHWFSDVPILTLGLPPAQLKQGLFF